MFVSSGWTLEKTYDAFIMGFDANFDNFSNDQVIQFIDLLTQAGLN